MNNLNNEWPISPTFLSLRQGCTEENANYNTDGIFYTDYLRGFLADLSHDKRIKNALSLFQFVPEDFVPLDPNAGDENHILVNSTNATVKWNYPVDERIAPMLDNRKIIRIDSGTFINNGKLCDSFRKCKDFKNTFFCFRQDSLVGIFAHRSLNRFNPKSKEYRDQLELIINDVNKGQDEKAQIKKEEVEINKKIHTYIHYTCPFSLFEEHIFPIYVQEHIIACLMFGQTAREKYKKEEAFYLDRDNMSLVEEDYNIEKIRDDEWEEKVYTIIERIDVFEQRLKERIEHRNTRFINDKFKNIEQQFRAKIRSIKMREGRALTAFSDTLSAAFGEIRENFDSSKDGFIRMFALKVDAENNTLVPIGWSDEDIESKEEFYFSAKHLEEIITRNEPLHVDDILYAASHRIREQFDRERDVFFIGKLTDDVVAYIVWKRHSPKLKQDGFEMSFEAYKDALKNFYSIALECYLYIRGYKIQNLLETVIKETAHESTHFVLPAIDVVDKHLTINLKGMIMPQYEIKYYTLLDKYNQHRKNVLELLEQLSETNRDSSIILSPDLKMKKTTADIHKLLNNSKSLLSSRAIENHKKIKMILHKKKISADVDITYFKHAIFNLLDNAIKYGCDGSYIYMDVDKQDEELKVQVISYGFGIPEEDNERIYHLFERGSEASKTMKGTGIGMYIVKKICMAHGGNVSHRSERLNDFNIPILSNYRYRGLLARKCPLGDIEKYEKEISKSTYDALEKEVVYDTRFVRYAMVFQSRINMPTYRNTFNITIPLH